MSINRQNYEEYFLLYADEELSIHQRMEVEWFVQQNPDLAKELTALQQARFTPESSFIFPGKEALLKIPQQHINTNNYETFFLSYIDNELSDDERKDVEKFVLQHPALQQEFTLLQQAQLQPEPVIFSHKESLYRHSTQKRVIMLRWLRMAAAAVLLLGIGVIVYKLPQKSHEVTGEQVAVKAPESTKANPKASTNEQPSAETPAPSLATTHAGDKPLVQQEEKRVAAATTSNKQKVTVPDKAQLPQQKQPLQVAVNIPSGKSEQKQEAQPVLIAGLQQQPPQQQVKAPVEATTTTIAAPAQTPQNNFAALNNTSTENTFNPAMYKELDTEADDERRTVYVASIQLNKSKVKSFLKKASRIFGGKNETEDTNDGKLQVANFELDKANK